MEGIIGIVVAIVVVAIIAKVLAWMKGNEIIECGSCNNRMTRRNFRAKGGCPRCGSDLIVRTGQQAK